MVTQNRWKIDDVLGVWPLHGLCGAWGGIAAVFSGQGIRRHGWRQSVCAGDRHAGWGGCGFAGSLLVYGALKRFVGLRLDAEAEFNGADLSIHKVSATAERETNW